MRLGVRSGPVGVDASEERRTWAKAHARAEKDAWAARADLEAARDGRAKLEQKFSGAASTAPAAAAGALVGVCSCQLGE